MFDRFWWWCNRKPSGPNTSYWALIFPGFMCGVLFSMGLLTLTSTTWWVGLLIILATLLLLFNSYHIDRKHGYVEYCYKAYLAYRTKIGKKLGKIAEEVEGDDKS